MPRFYLPENLSVGQTVDLPDNIVRHLNVLRVRPNENITLFDGKGKAHTARLTVLEKHRAEAEILHEDTTAIQPVISERCIVRLDGERAAKRLARWQEIVISACEQSGRNTVPPVLPIIGYREALDKMPSESTRLIMSINRARKLGDIRHPSGAIVFMVGPEGGWTEQEEQQAFEAGFQAVTLGKRILRTETAPLAAIAAMQTLWGDFT
ncbi:16S rRNA (uracil(1498)-N(3))-methyltransferase [Neisseria gonorrhoeae]|nr:16S rRNA (uracil(1498)-N(3))-methyltransferase [Neisseria gonorrhoeae]